MAAAAVMSLSSSSAAAVLLGTPLSVSISAPRRRRRCGVAKVTAVRAQSGGGDGAKDVNDVADGKKKDGKDSSSSQFTSEKDFAALQAEATELRAKLAAALQQQQQQGGEQQQQQQQRPSPRIDTPYQYRETLFSVPKEKTTRAGGWVSEAELMLVRGPSEVDAATPGNAESSSGEGGVVTRRLAIGLALTAATVAFSLVPSFWTRPKPPKPLYFYVVPLVEVQERLASLQQIATEGQWGTLKTELKRLTSLPLDIRSNLDNAAAYLEEKEAYERATELSRSILEYLDQVDFSKYFENLGTASLLQEKEFKDFSLKSLKAAGELLKQFMKLLPMDVVSAAQEQAAARTASMLAIQ